MSDNSAYHHTETPSDIDAITSIPTIANAAKGKGKARLSDPASNENFDGSGTSLPPPSMVETDTQFTNIKSTEVARSGKPIPTSFEFSEALKTLDSHRHGFCFEKTFIPADIPGWKRLLSIADYSVPFTDFNAMEGVWAPDEDTVKELMTSKWKRVKAAARVLDHYMFPVTPGLKSRDRVAEYIRKFEESDQRKQEEEEWEKEMLARRKMEHATQSSHEEEGQAGPSESRSVPS